MPLIIADMYAERALNQGSESINLPDGAQASLNPPGG